MTSPHTVLVVEDDTNTRTYMARQLGKLDCSVVEAATLDDGRAAIDASVIDLVFLDLGLGRDDRDGQRGRELFAHLQTVAPEVPVVVVTGDGSAHSAIELLRMGAWHYAVKPVEPEELAHLARTGLELSTARRALGVLRDERSRPGQPVWYVGHTSRMQSIAQVVERFAPTDVGLLIQGESGTGKEIVARALHERSKRSGEFVSINCAAIPKDLVESHLFGHEKGAFTGAFERQRGLMELANRGTLFLDELTMLAPELQAKLLRALQEFSFRRVGGQAEIKVDVRVISASNRDVGEAIRAGDFRADLYYRLCVMSIELPPLRDRVVDMPHFVASFLGEMHAKTGTPVSQITDAAMWALANYRWPGNIRELRNVIERAVILASGEPAIDLVHLPPNMRGMGDAGFGPVDPSNGGSGLPASLPPSGMDLKAVRDAWERSCVGEALARTGGNQSAAARLLGLTRDELRYRVEKFGMDGD